MPITPVETLRQVLQVRRLRNACREQLTNHDEYIGVVQQVRWYVRYYRRARAADFRLYLLISDVGVPLGYGAARLQGERLWITECVGSNYRRQGQGTKILEHLMTIGRREERELVAEIWSDNLASRSMHERAGFRCASITNKNGREVSTYVFP